MNRDNFRHIAFCLLKLDKISYLNDDFHAGFHKSILFVERSIGNALLPVKEILATKYGVATPMTAPYVHLKVVYLLWKLFIDSPSKYLPSVRTKPVIINHTTYVWCNMFVACHTYILFSRGVLFFYYR